MAEKLDQTLNDKLLDMDEAGSAENVSVIVTTRGKAALAELEAQGLAIAHAYENISAVSGRIRLGDLAKLEALDQVEKIEFDSEMHAL